MKLNRIENIAVNSAVWKCLQDRVVAPRLARIAGRVNGGRVLEVGCGSGHGAELILRRFGAAEVHAFDLDPDMVSRAKSRLCRQKPSRVHLSVADAVSIPFDAGRFDAVFDFAVIHHVPDWPRAVAEIFRVLRPGGRLYFEEFTRRALDSWLVRTVTRHPRENRFSAAEFVAELEGQGLVVGDRKRAWFGGRIVLGVGTKASR